MSDALGHTAMEAQQRDSLQTSILRRLSIALGLIIFIVAAVGAYISFEVSDIRTTQLQNTQNTCNAARGFSIFDTDLHRLIAGDKNPQDFQIPALCQSGK